jgi:hypothetical protein
MVSSGFMVLSESPSLSQQQAQSEAKAPLFRMIAPPERDGEQRVIGGFPVST